MSKISVRMTAVAAKAEALSFKVTDLDDTATEFAGNGLEFYIEHPNFEDEDFTAKDLRLVYTNTSAYRLTDKQQQELFKKFFEAAQESISKGDTFSIKGPLQTKKELRSKLASPANIKKVKAAFVKIYGNLKGVEDPRPENLDPLIKALKPTIVYFSSLWEKKRLNSWALLSDEQFKRCADLLAALVKVKPKAAAPAKDLTDSQKAAVTIMQSVARGSTLARLTYEPAQDFNSFAHNMKIVLFLYVLASALWSGKPASIKKAVAGIDPNFASAIPKSVRSRLAEFSKAE